MFTSSIKLRSLKKIRYMILGLLILLAIVLLNACGGGQTVLEPTATVEPTMTLMPTSTATATLTSTPTITPTPKLPVSPGTAMPISNLAISADNLDDVVELARWGKGIITDASYSLDGKLIAIATTIGVSIYQADTLEEKVYFETGAGVNSLAFSPDGDIIATGLIDSKVKLWNVMDGTLHESFEILEDGTTESNEEEVQVNNVAFSFDGKFLSSGMSDGTINLWQVSDGTLFLSPETKQGADIVSVFFSLDGQTIFSSSSDGTTYQRKVEDGELIHTFYGGSDIIYSVLSSDGKTLIVYDYYKDTFIFWDVESGKQISTIAETDDYSSDVTSIALSPDGSLIAAAREDHSVKIWSTSSGVTQNTFEDMQPKDGWYYLTEFKIVFSPDGQFLLMAGSNSIGIWDVRSSTLLSHTKIKSEEFVDLAFSPDGLTLASVEGPNINLWQMSDGSLLPSQETMQSNGTVDFSPDGTTLLASMFDESAQLWPLSEQGVRKSFESDKKEYITAASFSPDGQSIALEIDYPGKVEIRQISDGSLIKTMPMGTSSYYGGSLCFSSDGKYLAAALNDQVRLFQLPEGKLLKSYLGGMSIAFSPNGELLAGGAYDNTIRIWKVPDGEVLITIKDRSDSVWAVEFSPDGQYIVAGYADGLIEVFQVSDGTLLKSWKGHSKGVSDLLFNSNGELLTSSSYDGTIRIWGLKP